MVDIASIAVGVQAISVKRGVDLANARRDRFPQAVEEVALGRGELNEEIRRGLNRKIAGGGPLLGCYMNGLGLVGMRDVMFQSVQGNTDEQGRSPT